MIALACDHAGLGLKQDVMAHLEHIGKTYKDFGTFTEQSCDYPDYAVPAARAVSEGECESGIFICGTGVGMSIAANKAAGIRAALCRDLFTAEMTRLHNDANVLVLGARVTDKKLALEIIDIFLKTEFEGGRHADRVKKLNDLEKDWSGICG